MLGKIRVFVVVLALLSGIASAALAESTSSAAPLTVRAGVHPDFDRLVFDWPQATHYRIGRNGNQVTVHFSAPASPHLDSYVAHLTKVKNFSSLSDKDGNLTISFTVNPKAPLKDFVSGNSVVIDIETAPPTKPDKKPNERKPPEKTETQTQIAKTGKAKPPAPPASTTASIPPKAATAPPPAAPSIVSPPVAAPGPFPTPPPAPATAQTAAPLAFVQTPVAETQVAQSPTAKAPPGKSAPALVAATEPVSILPPAPATPQPTPGALDANKGLVLSAAPLRKDVVEQSPSDASGLPLSAAQNVTPVKKGPISPLDIGATPTQIAALDPHIATRVAVWQRAGYGYIVFDSKLTLNSDALAAGQAPPRIPLEQLELAKASGFRFPLPPETILHATHDGTIWKIFVSKGQPDVPVSTALIAQPDFALGARYLLPLPDAPEPIHFTDPIVNDDLILIPLQQNEAFSVGRNMADFKIVPAAQGLIIKPLTDKMVVRAVTDGVEITTEGGLHVSTASDTGASMQSAQKAKSAAAGKSIFDFAGWGGKPNETFTQARQRLQQTIVDVPEPERNRARLELARFYFAHGYGEEASALLAYLLKLVPDLKAHADFLALSGASKILAYRPSEGMKDFDTPLLIGQPEIEFWQAVASGELRDWAPAEEKFALTEDVLNGYPEPFYSRFYILSVEAALAVNKPREAADWLDRFETSPHNPANEAAILYLHGVLHAEAGHADLAEEAWKKASTMPDRLYKIRSELALIDLGVANGSLTSAQAADRLEALRFGWRGDDLEVDILHRLGQFYIDAKNVKGGLNVLAQAVALYPNSPLAPKIRDEMATLFRDVFLGDIGKGLSPLDALTIYQQYRALMPTGANGIAITRNLAERLVAIDLLGQAGDLLEELVKNKLQGEDKGRVSTRTAAIRLLDHKPEAALEALDLAKDETYTPDLLNERTLMRAKALSEMHKDDDALLLLKDNTSPKAKLLRADITMHAQHWADAAKALLDLIGPPPKPGEALQGSQPDWLINCAIALSLSGDGVALDKLATDYGPSMEKLPQNDTFRVLTRPDSVGQMSDIAAAQARIMDVDMFQGFLNTYRTADQPGEPPASKTP